MFNPNSDEAPFNPLPWTVLLLLAAIAGIEAVFQMAEAGFIGGPEAIGWRLTYGRQFGFVEELWDWMVLNGQFPFEHLIRAATYAFVHQGLVQALFVCVFLAAIGKFVGDRLHPVLVLVVFLVASIFGAIAYASFWDDRSLMLGGFPGVFGLIGALTWILFSTKRAEGEKGYDAFRLIAFFMTIQFIYKFIYGGDNQWFAEFTGFAIGFILSMLFGADGKLRIGELLGRARDRN